MGRGTWEEQEEVGPASGEGASEFQRLILLVGKNEAVVIAPFFARTKRSMAARTIGILSPGDMGSGLGRLLRNHSFRVVTNLQGRSLRTRELAAENGIEDVGSDAALLSAAEIVISVLVPSHAEAMAERVVSQSRSLGQALQTKFYIDANAIAPITTRRIGALFDNSGITLIDGSIIGGPPREKSNGEWYRPTIALSGPKTSDVNLDEVFDITHVGPNIGQASALKMSFASLTKVYFCPFLDHACMYI
jgi:3-hydroxyisobutyrate dehydrogenase-like beta-hydroxyacid dehydrogenase